MNKSSAVCVDASLIVRLIVDPNEQKPRSLWEQWVQEKREIVAPSLDVLACPLVTMPTTSLSLSASVSNFGPATIGW